MLPIQQALPLLRSPKRIFITTHHKPDGDAIGSILGLTHYLTALGHQVTPVAPSEIPGFLRWMPGANAVLDYEATPVPALNALKEAELIFCLDFNSLSRTKTLEGPLAEATAPKILIDHHMFPQDSFQYGMSQPEKSSTCEMVYDFILMDNGSDHISLDAAACLYTGLMTDTGAFRFSATTASSHAMAADLKARGLEHTPIHEAVYDSWSHNRMRFLGYVLIERMEIFPKFNAGLIALSRKDVHLFNLGSGDTEGVVNYPLSVSGIRFSTLITERSGEVRMSFRSKGDFDVNEFARTHFSGGGHFNASGGRSLLSFGETVTKFKNILAEIHPR
jgi:phosphoesterase RecJ-like protein